MKILSLLFLCYQKRFANGQTTHHTDLNVLALANSRAHSPLLSSHLSFSTNFLYKPSFSIPRPPGIASFLHLISNFLTSHPLLSEKAFFLETILLHVLSQAEYCSTFCLDAVRDEIKTGTFVYRLDTREQIQHRKLSKLMPMH